MFILGQFKSWCFHLTSPTLIEWWPAWWQTQALRARITCFSSLPLHLVSTLHSQRQTKEEAIQIEESTISGWPSHCQVTSFASVLTVQASYPPTENIMYFNMCDMLSDPRWCSASTSHMLQYLITWQNCSIESIVWHRLHYFETPVKKVWAWEHPWHMGKGVYYNCGHHKMILVSFKVIYSKG